MSRRTNPFALCLLVATAALAGCNGDLGVGAADELKIGDIDPKAPEGWPLAIGDRDIVPMGMAGGVGSRFEFWKGNCCINWIEGIPYTASWREEEALFGWKYYAERVEAKPTERWRQDYDPTWRPEHPLVLKPTAIEGGSRYPKRNHVPTLRIKGPLKWDGPLPIAIGRQ